MKRKSILIKSKLANLYHNGKSMAEMSEILNCSIHKIVYWMDKYKIKRRTRSEAAYIKSNPTGDPFKIKKNLSSGEFFLLGLGLGIYWGEGTKVTPHSLRVTNTNPEMIKVFRKFLLEICGLRKDKITYSIVCFNDTTPNTAKIYWAKELMISPEKFGKITQIPKQGKGTYKKKSQFGVCTIQASNIKLKTWLMQQLDHLADIV